MKRPAGGFPLVTVAKPKASGIKVEPAVDRGAGIRVVYDDPDFQA